MVIQIFRLEITQIGFDRFHALGTFRSVLAKQILLSSTPNKDGLVVTAAHQLGTDDHLNGIHIHTILDNGTIGENGLDAFRGRGKLLVAAVSVAGL